MAVTMLSGTTKHFSCTINDNAGVQVDPTTLDDVIIYLYFDADQRPIAAYTLNNYAGINAQILAKYGLIARTLTVDVSDNVLFDVEASDTEGREIGNLMMQISIVDNGGEIEKGKQVLCRVEKSL